MLRVSPTSRFIQYVVFFPTSFTQNVLKVHPCYVSMFISMFIHACISISFLFIAKQQPVLWIHHILFIHSLADEHLGCSQLLAIVNRAAMEHSRTRLLNICFQSGGYIPTRGTAGSYGNSMFNFLRQHQTISHSGCTIVHSQQQGITVLISLHPHKCLSFSVSLLWLSQWI